MMGTEAQTDNDDMGRYRLNPDSALPLAGLLETGGVSLAELARRCGYRNVAKGVRRLRELATGELKHYQALRVGLAAGLGLNVDCLDTAATDTRYLLWARDDSEYRDGFEPHVIWKTTQAVPSPIFAAAILGAERYLRFQPIGVDAARISEEAALHYPEGVPCYGRVVGFYVNYTPDCAVEFDLAGECMTIRGAAVRPGRSKVSLNGRPIATASFHSGEPPCG